jgi:hypothetical protein
MQKVTQLALPPVKTTIVLVWAYIRILTVSARFLKIWSYMMYYARNCPYTSCDIPALKQGWLVVTRIIMGCHYRSKTHNTSHT